MSTTDYSRVAVLVPCYNEAVTIGKVVDDCYLMVNGDDTYEPEAAARLCAPILDGTADHVVGDRLSNGTYGDESDRAFHGFGNNLARWLIKVLYGFEIETELSIHAADKRSRIVQVPIVYQDRPEGSESKLDTFSDGFKVLRMIASLFKDYKPFPFFGILCLLSLAISLCLGVPVVGEFMATHVAVRFPTAVLAAAFTDLSALFLVCGILLDTIVKANRRQWEIDCYRAFDEERERRGKGDC